MYIPIIFLTTKSEQTYFLKGMELGANDYLTKPFDDLELLRAFEVRLKRSEVLYFRHILCNYINSTKSTHPSAHNRIGISRI